jgi:hypothetical protein
MLVGLSIQRVLTEFLNLSKLLSKTKPEPLTPTIITLFPEPKRQLIILLLSSEAHCHKNSWPFMSLILTYLSESMLQPFFLI